jgi:nucleoside-diphosphate-sugar epimerase
VAPLLILGAGYIGAALAERALAAGDEVILADNWYATAREELSVPALEGAEVVEADIRRSAEVNALLARGPKRLYLLAAQASRPIADRDPDYTEETNLTGTRRVAEAAAAQGVTTVFASSLNVYGSPSGAVESDHPYGEQRDLAHLSKIYGELCLIMHARRAGIDLAVLRLGIVYGPSPVEHGGPESRTVVDKFRALAAAGEPLPLDDGGEATIGVVHVDDAARIMLEQPSRPGISVENVSAESLTVADVAAWVEGREPRGGARCEFRSPYAYRHSLRGYLAAPAGRSSER